jgi:hypothetical protein
MSKFHLRYVAPLSIDFSLIKKWLKVCRSSHGSWCKLSKQILGERFRLIHCKSRQIISMDLSTLPPPQFLALSYVWGDHTEQEQGALSKDYLPEGCPLTIEHSITVTMKLGLSIYGWIDRYCIWQDDDEDKHTQIKLMAQIYGSAQVTSKYSINLSLIYSTYHM